MGTSRCHTAGCWVCDRQPEGLVSPPMVDVGMWSVNLRFNYQTIEKLSQILVIFFLRPKQSVIQSNYRLQSVKKWGRSKISVV